MQKGTLSFDEKSGKWLVAIRIAGKQYRRLVDRKYKAAKLLAELRKIHKAIKNARKQRILDDAVSEARLEADKIIDKGV